MRKLQSKPCEWDDKSKRIVKEAVIQSVGTNLIFHIPFAGVPLSFTYLTGIWVNMVLRLLKKYKYSFKKESVKNSVSEFVASIIGGILEFSIGFTIANQIMTMMPLNILFALPIEVFTLALITYRFGKFCDKEFSLPGFTIDSFGELAELFLDFLKSYENVLEDAGEMVSMLSQLVKIS
jgi:uncharacterized protein (DUF697 family)